MATKTTKTIPVRFDDEAVWLDFKKKLLEDGVSAQEFFMKKVFEYIYQEGGKQMLTIYKYDGEYGVLEVDIVKREVVNDELDRDQIWQDANKDYSQQQFIYSSIIDELFSNDIDKFFPPRHESEYWAGEPTDFGYKALNDKFEFIVDAETAFFTERSF